MTFKFNLGQDIVITETSKQGFVKGRAEYNNGTPNSYLVQFVNGRGDLEIDWIEEANLSSLH